MFSKARALREEERARLVALRAIQAMERECAALQWSDKLGRSEWSPEQIAATMPIALVMDVMRQD